MAFRKQALTLAELLIAVAVVVALGSLLFPLFRRTRTTVEVTQPRVRVDSVIQAARQYGMDYDDRTPVLINGPYRSMKNVKDGALTQYGEQRTDGWPLLLIPYVNSRSVFVDPSRGDKIGIWSGPALATSDKGYVATRNTYRNQSRFPMYGMNYIFLSPIAVPPGYGTEPTPGDYAIGHSHSFMEAEDPAATIFFVPSQNGFKQMSPNDPVGTIDSDRGSYTVNAPGMWKLASDEQPYIVFWEGTKCSGDWCIDTNPKIPGNQRGTQNAYMEAARLGNTVYFLDGHSQFMTDNEMAAGTDYVSRKAVKSGVADPVRWGSGAVITDKSKYLWNLNQDFYGIY